MGIGEKDHLSTGEDESEVIVEVREVGEVLKLLPNLGLVSGRRWGNLLLEETADLLEALLLWLPRRRRRRHRRSNKQGFWLWLWVWFQ